MYPRSFPGGSVRLDSIFPQIRLDREEVGGFFQSLTDIETEIARDYDYSETPFAEGRYVPLDIQNKPSTKRWRYRWITHFGQFSLLRNYTTVMPEVEFKFGERELSTYKFGAGYLISEDDVMAVSRMGQSLEQEKVYAVQQAGAQTLNKLIANGWEEDGVFIPGFLNHPQALRSYAPYPLNPNATSQQKLAVLHDAANSPVRITKQQEKPDTMLMDLETYQHLTSEMIYQGTTLLNKTLLQHFMETTPHIKNVEAVNEMAPEYMDEIGRPRTRFIQAYKRDKRKVCAKIYQPLRWKDIRQVGIDLVYRGATMIYGGIHLPYPYSMHVVVLPE